MSEPISVTDADTRAPSAGTGPSPQDPSGPGPSARGPAGPHPAGAGVPADALLADVLADEPDGDELPGARALWILAFVFAAVGLFFPLAGLIAIGCGALAWRRGSGQGRVATFVAIATTAIGLTLMLILIAS